MNEQYAFYESELGYIKIGCADGAVFAIYFADEIDAENVRTKFSDAVFAQIREYLDGDRKNFDFPVILRGTDFQKRVWNALIDVPYGETRTYRDIAEKIGNPKAVRAVGGAIGKNPVSIAISCHRVIGSGDTMTGCAGGIWRKERLLELEKSKVQCKMYNVQLLYD